MLDIDKPRYLNSLGSQLNLIVEKDHNIKND